MISAQNIIQTPARCCRCHMNFMQDCNVVVAIPNKADPTTIVGSLANMAEKTMIRRLF